MSGRAVWNHTVVTGAGSRQVAWNGSSDNGQPVSAGIYAVRVKLLDAGNKVLQVLQAKVALTR
jgi:flagellar hook assembly protein FlgD